MASKDKNPQFRIVEERSGSFKSKNVTSQQIPRNSLTVTKFKNHGYSLHIFDIHHHEGGVDVHILNIKPEKSQENGEV